MRMFTIVRSRSGRPLRLLALFLILSGLIGPLSSSPAAAQQGAVPLDLAAMTLTPWDLEDAGLDGYGIGFSETVYPDAFVADMATSRGLDADELAGLLEDAGFTRAYYSYLYLEPGSDGVSDRIVTSYVLEFADDTGAADAWDVLEDESSLDNTEDIDGLDQFGDQSEGTLQTGEDADGATYAYLDTTVQIGNLHAGVAIVDWQGDVPENDEAESLVELMLDRVDAAASTDEAGLSNLAVRLAGETVAANSDLYLVREGEAVSLYGEDAAAADDRLDAADAIDQTAEYRLWQQLASFSDDPADSVWYYLSLVRFRNEQAASDWMDARPDQIEANGTFSNIEFEREEPDFGDAALGYTAEAEGGTTYRGITFRFGDLVATIDLSAAVIPSVEAVEALADQQVTCLEDEGCLEAIDLPRDVEAFITDAGDTSGTNNGDETPVADDTPTPEAEETEPADGGPVIYESELYDFSIEYNANDWQMTPEDDPTADEYEWITFGNEISTVWMVGDPDYGPDELGDCVHRYLLDQGFDNGAWEAEPIDDLVEEDGRAYATYSLTDVLFGMFGYLRLECRSIDSDSSLVIMHFAGVDQEGDIPQDEVDAVEELLAGIQTDGQSSGGSNTSNAGNGGDSASTASGGEQYVDPEWGFIVTWDPDQWVKVRESAEDGLQLQYVGDTLTIVVIRPVEDYDGDPDACLQGIITGSDTESDLVPADDLPVPDTVDGAAGGLYLLGDFATMYVECRTLVPGQAVLDIRYGGPNATYADALPALEDLLAGIDESAGS